MSEFQILKEDRTTKQKRDKQINSLLRHTCIQHYPLINMAHIPSHDERQPDKSYLHAFDSSLAATNTSHLAERTYLDSKENFATLFPTTFHG
jgi:hypothetical protein